MNAKTFQVVSVEDIDKLINDVKKLAKQNGTTPAELKMQGTSVFAMVDRLKQSAFYAAKAVKLTRSEVNALLDDFAYKHRSWIEAVEQNDGTAAGLEQLNIASADVDAARYKIIDLISLEKDVRYK